MIPPEQAGALRRAARRYHDRGRFARHYVASKLRRDPLHADLLSMGDPLGHVVDIGCGRGQLAALLLEAGLADHVTGLDWNRAHLDQATAALTGLAFEARPRDLETDQSVPGADTVILIDVLYQLTTGAQHRLIEAAGQAARRCLLIRTLDRTLGKRGLFATAMEHLGRRLWPGSGAHVNPLTVMAIVARMTAAGFIVETRPSSQGTPFANVLLVGRR